MRAFFIALFFLHGFVFADDGFFVASSVRDEIRLAECAFDGVVKTYWSSLKNSKEDNWLQVDLGSVVSVSGMRIHWGRGYAVEYKLEASIDGQGWEMVYHCIDGDGGMDEIGGLEGKGRYFRILFIKNGMHNCYRIHEVGFEGDAGVFLKKVRVQEEKRKARISAAERRVSKKKLLELGVDEIVFAARENGPDGHWYANFAYYAQDENRKCYRKMGRLCKLDVGSGKVTYLIDDPEGSVRDPAVHYDAKKIIFSWRKGGTDSFHLYEIGVDGSGLKQLTDGIYDDIEPAYLPDGGIVFVSSRCKRYVNCWLTQVAVLHRCDGDGKNIRPISGNIEHDNTPWVLPDGRILYQRWEYVDRSQVDYHHLWTSNPDGTGQMVYYGNMHPSDLFIDAKGIPGTEDVLLIKSPSHGKREHAGHVAIVSDKFGPDDKAAMRNISLGKYFRDPYPLCETTFLVARFNTMVLMGLDGEYAEIYSLSKEHGIAELHEPRPVIRRQRERVIPPRVDLTKDTGTLILTDIYTSRNMEGVKRGEIKKLLVLEVMPKPINFTGGMDPLTYGGSFTIERILGTIPVEEDGSAFMELPANRGLFFVAMDSDNNSVKRMQSFVSVMPGENTSCIGCHEERGRAPINSGELGRPKALKGAPYKPVPVEGVPQIFDYPRDIQPILDKHCVKCHGYDKRKGGVILTGDRGPIFSHSYVTLTMRQQIADGRNLAKSNYPPRTLGAAASKLTNKINGKHHKVKLSAHEQNMIRYWIESGALYPGTYASLGCGSVGGYIENAQVNRDEEWETHKPFHEAISNRCVGCHEKTLEMSMPMSISDEMKISFWRLDWNDRRLRFSRHLMFNLSRPGKSMLLLAPLSKKAGGLGLCKNSLEEGADGPADVFEDVSDEGYKAILEHIAAGKEFLETKSVRFDMPQFKPNAGYVREMKRYGVLPDSFDVEKDSIDVYETDQKYWEMLH